MAGTTRASGIRQRNREAISREIIRTARSHLATDGAAGLSLRAVARDLGMASSAIYRYFPSRDDLLTRLIIEGYDAVGTTAERAESAVPRERRTDRFRAVALAVRRWAFEHEHEYALLYGSPVPGYQAPPDTIAPATRVGALLIGILRDAVESSTPPDLPPLPPAVADSLAPMRGSFNTDGVTIPDPLIARGLIAWTDLFGAVSFDLFGHRHNVVLRERDIESPFFAFEVERLIEFLGL